MYGKYTSKLCSLIRVTICEESQRRQENVRKKSMCHIYIQMYFIYMYDVKIYMPRICCMYLIMHLEIYLKYISHRTDSVRCVVGVRCQAITQVKQLFAGSVLGWLTAGPRLAHRNAEREEIFQRLVDWGQTLLNGRLCRPGFSQFTCALEKGEKGGGYE